MTPRHATSAPKVRFAATLGEEPEVEVVLVQRSGARAFLSELLARRSSEFVGEKCSQKFTGGRGSEFQ